MKIQEIREMLDSTITANGKREITGNTLNLVLSSILDYLEEHPSDVPDTPVVPTNPMDILFGSWTQRWDIGAGESMGLDNWGTKSVIYRDENTRVKIDPVFGSLGFIEDGRLEYAGKNSDGSALYRLFPGIHNLLGEIPRPLYFVLKESVYIPEYNVTVPGYQLCLQNIESGDSKVLLNDWAWVTNYTLTKQHE